MATIRSAKKLLLTGVLATTLILSTGVAFADEARSNAQNSGGLDTATVENLYGIAPRGTADDYLRLDLNSSTTAGSQLGKKDSDSSVYLNAKEGWVDDNRRINIYGVGWRYDDTSGRWVSQDCTVGTPQLRWLGKHTFRQNINEWGYSHAQITAWRNTAPSQVLRGLWSPDYAWEPGVTNL